MSVGGGGRPGLRSRSQGLPELLWLVGSAHWTPKGSAQSCYGCWGPTGAPGGLPELLWLGWCSLGLPRFCQELPWLGMGAHWDS